MLDLTVLEKQLACASRGISTSLHHTPEPSPRLKESLWIAARNELGADEQPGGTLAQVAHHLAIPALLLLETVKPCTLDAQRVFIETTDRMRIEMSV